MRVLAVSANYPDPIHNWAPWNASANLALAQAGHTVEIIAPRPVSAPLPIGPFRNLYRVPRWRDAPEGRVHHPRFTYLWPKSIFYGLAGDSYRHRIGRYVLQNISRCDVIHAHHAFPDGFGVVEIARRWTVPLIIDLHGDALFESILKEDRTAPKWRTALRAANSLICISERLKSMALAEGLDDAQLHVIPLGVDTDLFSPGNKNELKHELGVAGKFVFITVGQLIPRKGISILIRAVQNMSRLLTRDELVQCRFMIIGEGPETRRLKRMAAKAGVADLVQFLGRRSLTELRRWYAAADALVLPSLLEGRPTVVNEAMASGTAVIASDVSGVPEQVVHGVTGLLVQPTDVDGLAAALIRLIRSPMMAKEMGDAGRNRVIEAGWTWPVYADRVTEVYERAREA